MKNEMEIYEKGREVVLEELDKLFSKGTLSPAETEAAKAGVCLLKEMDETFGGEMMDDGYSERRGGGRSSRRSYENRSYEGMSRDWPGMDGRMPYREYAITSYDGRGGNQGGGRGGSSRAMSRDGRGGYSGHSINDRVVEKLENLMDSAESDFERQKIREFIRFVRDDEMNM